MSNPGTTFPQSSALAEATTDSLAVLVTRDPEKFSSQDRGRIISMLREQRARLASAAAAGKKPGAEKVSGGSAPSISFKTTSDLDL